MEMPTLEAIKRLVEKRLGVALIPRLSAQTEIARKQLAGLSVKEMRLERRVHLIYRRGATLSHAAKAFLTVGLLTLLHLDIHNLAAKGAQDLLDSGVLGGCLARLLFRPA